MNPEHLPVVAHHWKVQFTHPRPTENKAFPGSTYNATAFVGIIAMTIDECIAKVREMYPKATIYTVSHQGRIQLDGRTQ